MRQEVLESECDRCHTTIESPLPKFGVRGQFDIPRGWLHIQANSKTVMEFSMDLCDECKRIVLEAAGRFRS